jgi:DNA-binding transcriptional LysR family regulator
MDLRQLRYFTVLAEELHFRRAAERLNITQAPLSIAIQNLERELGGQLFSRNQRRVALTEIGTSFREHALTILERVETGLADIQEMVSGQAGQLRIGFTAASSLLSFFPQIICAFRIKYPKVRVTLRELSSVGQISALENREIDIGIVRGQDMPQVSGISFTKLLRDRLVVAMRCDSHLSDRETLMIADLKGEPLIFYPRSSGVGIYDQFVGLCRRAGFSPLIVQEATDSSTIIGLAATGLGVAVVPSELQCINVPDVIFRPLRDEDAVTGLYLGCRAGEGSALIARFRHMVQASLTAWKKENPGHEDIGRREDQQIVAAEPR